MTPTEAPEEPPETVADLIAQLKSGDSSALERAFLDAGGSLAGAARLLGLKEQMTAKPSMALLVTLSLAAICRAQEDFDAAIGEAQSLVRQAAQQHADGDVHGARESIVAAGDLLHEWVGNSDAIAQLEDALGAPIRRTT